MSVDETGAATAPQGVTGGVGRFQVVGRGRPVRPRGIQVPMPAHLRTHWASGLAGRIGAKTVRVGYLRTLSPFASGTLKVLLLTDDEGQAFAKRAQVKRKGGQAWVIDLSLADVTDVALGEA